MNTSSTGPRKWSSLNKTTSTSGKRQDHGTLVHLCTCTVICKLTPALLPSLPDPVLLFPLLLSSPPPTPPYSIPSARSKSHQLLWALPGSTYRLLKGVFLLLLIVVLALFLFTLLILFYSTVDSCGPHCPTSPLQVMLSALHPHIQYTRSPGAPL